MMISEIRLKSTNRIENCLCTAKTLLNSKHGGNVVQIVKGQEEYVNRIMNHPISFELFRKLKPVTKHIGITENFKEVIDDFKVSPGRTPSGFRVECMLDGEGIVRFDLVRDISYGENGTKRPTNVLFSADTANPYEIEPIKDMIANLTCNPGIIYDLFINNPKVNTGNKFKSRDEVMQEIGRILGPGVDISVELNDPFRASKEQILEEAAKFKEMLSKHRVVIKVPHTGPVNAENVHELLTGNKKLQKRYNAGSTQDMFRGHNLALMLHEHGYKVNFTLMFEPYQTALALLAKPYFINSFIRHRNKQSYQMQSILSAYEVYKDESFLNQLRLFMIEHDYLAPDDENLDLLKVKNIAETTLEYRNLGDGEGKDGLNSARHSLRVLRQSNLPDTRLIICSMEGPRNYPDIDRMMMEDEFKDMTGRVVITTEPAYLAQFTSTNQVVSYQRRFMNAANGQQ